jgi:hypothetical protein
MMPEFAEISDTQRKEIDIWADGVIESNKQLMASGKAYWIWSDRLYYQPGKDTWVDESWWIEIAKKRFIEHQDDDNEIGWAVIPALEILVYHFPEQYRDYARNQIDRWYDLSGGHDPEYWWDLILAVYPDHPVTELLFEQQDSSWETGMAIRLGDCKTEINIKEYLLSELEDDDIFLRCDLLDKLDKDIFDRMFSASESRSIQAPLLEVAKKELSLDLEQYLGRGYEDRNFILPSAIIMGWQEIIDALAHNTNYLEGLLHIFKVSSHNGLLWWSLTKNHKLTESLILNLYPQINSLYKVHQIGFPSHSFALAIAWKRSQSQMID